MNAIVVSSMNVCRWKTGFLSGVLAGSPRFLSGRAGFKNNPSWNDTKLTECRFECQCSFGFSDQNLASERRGNENPQRDRKESSLPEFCVELSTK